MLRRGSLSNTSKKQLESEVNDLKDQLKKSKSQNDGLTHTISELNQQFAANQLSFAMQLHQASTANIATQLAMKPQTKDAAATQTISPKQYQTSKISPAQRGWLMFFAGAAVATVVTALAIHQKPRPS